MFPFASHLVHGYSLEYCSDLLAKAGALANKYDHRLTTHPGQFTQLGSPNPAVVESSLRELEYNCEMLDLMGIGVDGVMVVHVSFNIYILRIINNAFGLEGRWYVWRQERNIGTHQTVHLKSSAEHS